jgi:hypothetical protein
MKTTPKRDALAFNDILLGSENKIHVYQIDGSVLHRKKGKEEHYIQRINKRELK